jgi:hypothetical protein
MPPKNDKGLVSIQSFTSPPEPSALEDKQSSDINYDMWLKSIYSVKNFSEDDVKLLYEAVEYQGFNREIVLRQLYSMVKDTRVVTQIVMAIALRGPNAGSKLMLTNGLTCERMGIPATGGRGTKKLTCNKIQAATADLAAYYLKKFNAPKRIPVDCPGFLQFPSAAAIKMPDELRAQHIVFAQKFSQVIGGKFNEQIYAQMTSKAYLEPSLQLF